MAAMSDDEAMLRLCARRAGRYASPYLTRDDVMQEGRLAMLLARRDGRVPADAVHAQHYLRKRVLGAMIDAHRTEWRQRPPTVDEFTDLTPVDSAPNQPDALAQMRQAAARVLANGSAGLVRCVELLAAGLSVADVARELRVSESRVSQLRGQARNLAGTCW